MYMADPALCLRCMTPMGKGSRCPKCGWTDSEVYDLQYARPGAVLSGRYLLGEYVRKNGEGALYAAFDKSLQQKVWIREYFPQTIAQRSLETGKITPLSGCGAQYKALMSDFVDICNEIRRLSVTEPVVPLENVISENNTVYAVFKGLELIPFEELLERQGGAVSPRHALALLMPLCGSLGTLHTHGHIHRGISPHTVYADASGKLFLWDFALSATRTAGSELNAELFPGYSAPEQYSPSGWQGSWTDVYAVAALLYRAITGIVPPKSTRVDAEHPLSSLSQLLPDLPRNISEAVADAMQPDTQERTQAIQTFVSRLIEPKSANTAVYDTIKVARAGRGERGEHEERGERQQRRARRERGQSGSAKYVILGMLVMLALLGGVIWYLVSEVLPPILSPIGPAGPASAQEQPPPSSQAPQSSAQENLRMPNFFGKQVKDIQSNPDYERFDFSVEHEFSADYPAGTVIDQTPLEGNEIASSGRIPVKLKVSKGPVVHAMPDVVGRPLEEAIEILENLEGVTIDTYERYDSAAKAGHVVSSTPEAGVEFDPKRRSVILFFMPESSVSDARSQPSDSVPDIGGDGPSDDDGYSGPFFRND